MSVDKRRLKKIFRIAVGVIGAVGIGMSIVAKKKKSSSIYENDKEQKNPYEGKKVILVKDQNDKENADGVRGHLKVIGDADYKPSFYEKRIKRGLDIILSFGGLVLLSPVYAAIAVAIKVEDPGPVLFTQKRIGRNKQFFKLHKFRSMKMSTPHDVPTHQLENPDQYITKVGKFLRAHSLDELPQIWDIFIGNMSVIGPRPALWNQDLLTAERDKYGANDVKPGLTGWAQINGRDELEIEDKARLDGEYVEKIGVGMDIKCFLGSLHVFRKDESVVEGGVGKMKKVNLDKEIKKKILVICQYYYPENFQITPICERLAKDGFEITVLTGLPNYPTGVIPNEYKNDRRDEWINGVHVLRCYEIGRKKGAAGLALNYISYWWSATMKVRHLSGDYDLVFVYQLSPITMGIPAIKYAKRNKMPMLLYCCDLWPESIKMYIKNENNPIFKYFKRISRRVYSASDYILTQSNSFIKYLNETHSIPLDKIEYLPAFADDRYLTEDFVPDNDIIDFVFLGNLGIAQDLIAVLTAVKQIKDIPNFKVHFVGDGSMLKEMKEFVAENELENIVCFYGRRPVDEMPKYYKLADACIVSLNAENQTGLTLPAKVQEYMAAGKPIIGMISGSAQEVISESKCGLCVDSGDIKGLADIMRNFIINYKQYEVCGENGRNYFIQNYKKDIFMNKLESKLREMMR